MGPARRRTLGRARFHAALRELIREHRFGRVRWDDALASIARSAGRDLQPFYAQWFDRIELPAADADDPRPSLARAMVEELLIALFVQHENRQLDSVQWLRESVGEEALTRCQRR